MLFERLHLIAIRTFSAVAFLLLGLAVLEWIVRQLGGVLWRTYAPGRLVEFSAMFMVFVIALLLQQVRDDLKRRAIA